MGIVVGKGNPSWNRYGLKNTDGTSAAKLSVARSGYQVRADARAGAAQRMKEKLQKAKEEKRKLLLKRKKLNYNFKQISTRILQAKTSGNARQVVTSARQKVAQLRRKVKMSNLDSQELLNAIIHAEAMVRVAKKKLKHLEEEENVKLRGGPCEAEMEEKEEESAEEDRFREIAGEENVSEFDMDDLQELMEIYQDLMQEAMEDMESMQDLEELVDGGVGVEMDPEDLELLKKKHRSKELREIMEADMKYLKALFNKLAKEQQSGSGGISGSGSESVGRSSPGYSAGGVSLELSGVDIPVETQMMSAAEVVEGGMIDASV